MEKGKEQDNKKRSYLALAVGGLAIVAAGLGLKHIASGLHHLHKG